MDGQRLPSTRSTTWRTTKMTKRRWHGLITELGGNSSSNKQPGSKQRKGSEGKMVCLLLLQILVLYLGGFFLGAAPMAPVVEQVEVPVFSAENLDTGKSHVLPEDSRLMQPFNSSSKQGEASKVMTNQVKYYDIDSFECVESVINIAHDYYEYEQCDGDCVIKVSGRLKTCAQY